MVKHSDTTEIAATDSIERSIARLGSMSAASLNDEQSDLTSLFGFQLHYFTKIGYATDNRNTGTPT